MSLNLVKMHTETDETKVPCTAGSRLLIVAQRNHDSRERFDRSVGTPRPSLPPPTLTGRGRPERRRIHPSRSVQVPLVVKRAVEATRNTVLLTR